MRCDGGGGIRSGSIQSISSNVDSGSARGDILRNGFQGCDCRECSVADSTSVEFISRFPLSRFAGHESGDARIAIRMFNRGCNVESPEGEGDLDCRLILRLLGTAPLKIMPKFAAGPPAKADAAS